MAPETPNGWWLVPDRPKTSQRIDVTTYPDWPELAAVPVVVTWDPYWRKYETLNLSGDVVVSESDSMGRERIRLTVASSAELTSAFGTRR